jgi:hypothetical protein
VFTTHGSVMMFPFAIPMFEAIAVIYLSQMLGARDLPFPRSLRFWLLVLSSWGLESPKTNTCAGIMPAVPPHRAAIFLNTFLTNKTTTGKNGRVDPLGYELKSS